MNKHIEEILLFIGLLFFVGIFIFYLFQVLETKNKMCRDFGSVIYNRELTWFECIVL